MAGTLATPHQELAATSRSNRRAVSIATESKASRGPVPTIALRIAFARTDNVAAEAAAATTSSAASAVGGRSARGVMTTAAAASGTAEAVLAVGLRGVEQVSNGRSVTGRSSQSSGCSRAGGADVRVRWAKRSEPRTALQGPEAGREAEAGMTSSVAVQERMSQEAGRVAKAKAEAEGSL